MALALDEPNDDDQTCDVDGFTFCVNKELLTTIGGAAVDLTYMGFTVEPTIPLEGGGGCGGSCGTGTCGS